MTDMMNTITADGASWSGAAPVANLISAIGASWSGGGAGVSSSGILELAGIAIASASAAAAAEGELRLTGGGRIIEGNLMPSARRTASPSESRNGGHLETRQ